MMKITYYAKEIVNCEYPLESPDHIAKHYAGQVKCPNCGNDHAVVVNDGDTIKDWAIECGDCDFQHYGVEVIDCSKDSNEDYYALFPDECPCSLCSNEEPDNEWCWKRGDYVEDVSESYPITMHISASAYQDCTVDVPQQVIAKGKQAVFHYILENATAESYTDWDYDCLDNEGYSYETHSQFVAMHLGPSVNKIPPKPFKSNLEQYSYLIEKLMSGETLSTEELMSLQKLGDVFEEE